jgi:hypothetical protein
MNKCSLGIIFIFSSLFLPPTAFAKNTQKINDETIINMVHSIEMNCAIALPRQLNTFITEQATFNNALQKASKKLKKRAKEITIDRSETPYVPTGAFKEVVDTIRAKTVGFNTDFRKFLSGQNDTLQACESAVDDLLELHRQVKI